MIAKRVGVSNGTAFNIVSQHLHIRFRETEVIPMKSVCSVLRFDLSNITWRTSDVHCVPWYVTVMYLG